VGRHTLPPTDPQGLVSFYVTLARLDHRFRHHVTVPANVSGREWR
jgi:hypothetical protein